MSQQLKQQFIAMLTLQDKMNRKVHAEWELQDFAFYRALWLECGELIEHHGYKWWKKQRPDMEQVRLEVVDIWHFGMSMLFDGRDIERIADGMCQTLESARLEAMPVLDATEMLAEITLASRKFSVPLFWQLLQAVDMDAEALYRAYVGKNVLNFFRQDNGYQDGSYIKIWDGREDNEHLVELSAGLDTSAQNYDGLLYQSLQQRYKAVQQAAEPA